jgi:hypothetical protein
MTLLLLLQLMDQLVQLLLLQLLASKIQNQEFIGHMVAVMALMEAPAIVIRYF